MTSDTPASHVTAPRTHLLQRPALKVLFFLGVALFVSFAVFRTSDEGYDERLTDISLRRSVSPELYRLVQDAPELKALVLDNAQDHELMFKFQLALEKYSDGKTVLQMFGGLAEFQKQLKQYGEGIVPVIGYFLVNEFKTVRASSFLAGKWKEFREKLPGPFAKHPSEAEEISDSGPQLRGDVALSAIAEKGHRFLGQFVVDAQTGKVTRLQSERVLDGVKDFMFSGIQDAERRHAENNTLRAQDLVWAGADVVGLFGSTKALKVFRSLRHGSKAKEVSSVAGRTGQLAGPLVKGRFGKWVAKKGAQAGTAYVVVSHPQLLLGLFVEIGKAFGLPAITSKLLGSGLLCTLAFFLLWPLWWIGGAIAWILRCTFHAIGRLLKLRRPALAPRPQYTHNAGALI